MEASKKFRLRICAGPPIGFVARERDGAKATPDFQGEDVTCHEHNVGTVLVIGSSLFFQRDAKTCLKNQPLVPVKEKPKSVV